MSMFDDFLKTQAQNETLPLYTEMAIDFDTGEIIVSYEQVKKFYDTTETWIGTQFEFNQLSYKRPNTVFYIVGAEDLATTKKTEDFEILNVNPEITVLTGTHAILVWVWKALKTDSNRYPAYSSAFGNRLTDEIGKVYDRTVKTQLINSMIEDCLRANPYITRVYNFVNSYDLETLKLNVSFDIDTIYGTIDKKEVEKLNVKTSI